MPTTQASPYIGVQAQTMQQVYMPNALQTPIQFANPQPGIMPLPARAFPQPAIPPTTGRR